MKETIKFYYQFIPPCNWYNNCRMILKDNSWNEIRKEVIQEHDNKCYWCNEKMKGLHCHEVFVFENNIQVLKEFIPLCPTCHEATHIRHTVFKYTDIPDYIEKHIRKITNKSCKRDIKNFIKDVRKDFKKYMLDLSYVVKYAKEKNIPLESNFKKLDKYNIKDYIKLKPYKNMKLFNFSNSY